MNTHFPPHFHQGLEIVLAPVIQTFIRYMKEQGLSMPQINALMYIFHAGECQVADIGTLAEVSSAAASQLVERLVQQDLVERREDPADRRMKILKLSRKGLDLFQRGITANPILLEVMASLTDEQRETVQAAFTILAQAARQIQGLEKRKVEKHA